MEAAQYSRHAVLTLELTGLSHWTQICICLLRCRISGEKEGRFPYGGGGGEGRELEKKMAFRCL